MGKHRRGGFVFVTWCGDHKPRHVHIFKDKRLILKWNLEANVVMKGKLTSKLKVLIDELVREGKL